MPHGGTEAKEAANGNEGELQAQRRLGLALYSAHVPPFIMLSFTTSLVDACDYSQSGIGVL